MIHKCYCLSHVFLSRQNHAKFLTDSDNCGNIFHSKDSGYGENLFICGSSDLTFDCYDPAMAMNGLCELACSLSEAVLEWRYDKAWRLSIRADSETTVALVAIQQTTRRWDLALSPRTVATRRKSCGRTPRRLAAVLRLATRTDGATTCSSATSTPREYFNFLGNRTSIA